MNCTQTLCWWLAISATTLEDLSLQCKFFVLEISACSVDLSLTEVLHVWHAQNMQHNSQLLLESWKARTACGRHVKVHFEIFELSIHLIYWHGFHAILRMMEWQSSSPSMLARAVNEHEARSARSDQIEAITSKPYWGWLSTKWDIMKCPLLQKTITL